MENTNLQNIESVHKSTLNLINGKYKKHRSFYIYLVIFVFILGFSFLGFFFLFFLIATIGGAYALIYQRMQAIFMEQVAKILDYKYVPSVGLPTVTGNLFKIGHSQQIKNVIIGSYNNLPIKIFNYYFLTGQGKNQRSFNYTIFEVETKSRIPDLVLLKNDLSSFGSLNTLTSGKEKLNLEGDFNKYFKLYILKDFQIEALQIFTPDVMAELIDKFKNVDMNIEINENKIYIFYEKLISKKDEILLSYNLIQKFSEKFAHNVDDVGDHLKNYREYFK